MLNGRMRDCISHCETKLNSHNKHVFFHHLGFMVVVNMMTHPHGRFGPHISCSTMQCGSPRLSVMEGPPVFSTRLYVRCKAKSQLCSRNHEIEPKLKMENEN